ncbi:hypothetical protein LCGC14_0288680 [marine sediment metagenome]|uniref:HNH domain-containing protein n=1 Tax=marine sediment metagenome TaxID=412755 RepID=A0A0F9WEW2_9ZZZZ
MEETLTQKRQRRKKMAVEVMGGSCKDCGATFPGYPEVFDFDHMWGKREAIGRMLPIASWKEIAEELEKCELVCSNCHRMRTAERRKYGCTIQ